MADRPADLTLTADPHPPALDQCYLLVFDGDGARRFALGDGEVIIGRSEGVALRLSDSSVSRKHARVVTSGGVTRLTDLDSHNGVRVNDERIGGEVGLRDGDLVSVGNVPLLFHEARSRPVAATPGAPVRQLALNGRAILVADPAMLRVYSLLERVGASELSVLLQGETGSGKEVAALLVHHASPRRDGPFVALNCAALPETLAESELFGHERGAFSGAAAAKPGLFERADGGTVFLDEVGELSLSVQAKLLRVLEERRVLRLGSARKSTVDVRLVAATNRDLDAAMRDGRFRSDLFFRLRGAQVWLPPLRDRPAELLPLAHSFFDEARKKARRPAARLSPALCDRLAAYDWPGNVRELANVMSYLAATVQEPLVVPAHLPESFATAARPAPSPAAPAAFRPLDEEVRELERSRMTAALAACDGNRTRAAALIGMPRRTFLTKLKLYGLD